MGSDSSFNAPGVSSSLPVSPPNVCKYSKQRHLMTFLDSAPPAEPVLELLLPFHPSLRLPPLDDPVYPCFRATHRASSPGPHSSLGRRFG